MLKEKSLRGGYILISLGMIELSGESAPSISYQRLIETKKHIVLTDIVVSGEHKVDMAVNPIYGSHKITFINVYGYDIEVTDEDEVTVSEYVAPSSDVDIPEPTIADAGKVISVGEDGKYKLDNVPSGGSKLYKHTLNVSEGAPKFIDVISTISDSFVEVSESIYNSVVNIISRISNNIFMSYSGTNLLEIILLDITNNTTVSYYKSDIISDTVTEL